MANKCKFEKEQYQVSYDSGATWENVIPEQLRKGELLEYSSSDCSGINTLYRWRVLEGQYLCDGTSKYKKEIQDESYDGGTTWYPSYPTVYRTGQYIGVDVDFCNDKFVGHYIYDTTPYCEVGYKWNGYKCVYVDPLKVLKCDNNSTLTNDDTRYYTNDYTLITAEIGDCVTSIGNGAFDSCASLTSCTIGSGVTSIGDSAFYYCTSLISIDIPNSVTSIGNQAFSDCTSLTSCTIGNSVTTIGDYAFSQCYSLTSINIPSGVTSIGGYAFSNCSGLTSIDIPDSVTSIGNAAFHRCSSLTNIDIPSGVTSIGQSTFHSCSGLTTCTLGSGVTSIGTTAFYGCTSLTSVIVYATTPPTAGEYIFEGTNCQIYVPCSSVAAYKSASRWSSYADRIQGIPPCGEPPTFDGKWVATYSSTYYGTSSTTSADCDSSSAITSGEIPHIIDGSRLRVVVIGDCVTTIGDGALSSMTQTLSSITISNTVTSIGDRAFDMCRAMRRIDIPNSVRSIGQEAFWRCGGLEVITIGTGITTISDYAFADCGAWLFFIDAVTPPTVGVKIFHNTGCRIYVPAASVDTYKSASGWSQYADRIQADYRT